MVRDTYKKGDFDFALICVNDLNKCWIMPFEVFVSYSGPIHLVAADNRQRKSKSIDFIDGWQYILNWAATKEILLCSPIKVGEAGDAVIPSQTSKDVGVET